MRWVACLPPYAHFWSSKCVSKSYLIPVSRCIFSHLKIQSVPVFKQSIFQSKHEPFLTLQNPAPSRFYFQTYLLPRPPPEKVLPPQTPGFAVELCLIHCRGNALAIAMHPADLACVSAHAFSHLPVFQCLISTVGPHTLTHVSTLAALSSTQGTNLNSDIAAPPALIQPTLLSR